MLKVIGFSMFSGGILFEIILYHLLEYCHKLIEQESYIGCTIAPEPTNPFILCVIISAIVLTFFVIMWGVLFMMLPPEKS